jgi:glucokinase-like ROK family protein
MPNQKLDPNTTLEFPSFEVDPLEFDIINKIRKFQQISRSDLCAATGFSRIKISTILSKLLDQDYIIEIGEGSSSGGRRPRLVALNRSIAYVIGVDMGATSVDIAVADLEGKVLTRRTTIIDVRDGPEMILSTVCTVSTELIVEISASPVSVISIGVGVPGPVEFISGVLVAPPIMPGWEAYPIREFINNTFPNARVIIDNDVNVMALGEFNNGSGQENENFIFVKIGTGIGAGIICNKQVYRGNTGCAGDIGHICADRQGPVCRCGNTGCLEAMAAGPAIAASAMESAISGKSPNLARIMESKNGTLTAEDVGRAAAEGDPISFEIIRRSGRMIGEVLASLVNFFNPDMIIIGGGVSNIGYQLLSSIRQSVLHRSLPLATRDLDIVYSTLGSQAGTIGAINLALENIFVVNG